MLRRLVILISILLAPALLYAQDNLQPTASTVSGVAPSDRKPRGGPPLGWYNSVNIGYLHQLNSDTDSKNSFDVNRFAARYSLGYQFTPSARTGVSVGYSQHDYSFDNKTGGSFADPWNRIDSLKLSLPTFFDFAENWNAIVVPTVRTTVEQGVSYSDGVNGGIIAGAGYRYNDRLLIGPGIGVLSQLEDSASVFPILVIDWEISDKFSLATGRGFGSTQGPGLSLNYQATRRTGIFLLGRYERLRFKLDKDNALAPEGVGEDKSFPLLLGVSYRYGRLAVNLTGGVEFGGKLRLENRTGKRITSEGYDAAPVLGLTASARL